MAEHIPGEINSHIPGEKCSKSTSVIAANQELRAPRQSTFEAPSDYVRDCFTEYGLVTDSSGRYSALYRPYHLIGLELGISVASAALRGEPTGEPRDFQADVVATAKRDLAAGEVLDGEGGSTVWGRLMPAATSVEQGALPIGLAHGVKLHRQVASGQPVHWADVDADETSQATKVRREMEVMFAPAPESPHSNHQREPSDLAGKI